MNFTMLTGFGYVRGTMWQYENIGQFYNGDEVRVIISDNKLKSVLKER